MSVFFAQLYCSCITQEDKTVPIFNLISTINHTLLRRVSILLHFLLNNLYTFF